MSQPENPPPSDLEAIRRYVQLASHNNPDNPAKLKRSALLGTTRVTSFSLPTKVISEMERRADLEDATLSAFVFRAVVEKILTEKIQENRNARRVKADADRVRARKGPDTGER